MELLQGKIELVAQELALHFRQLFESGGRPPQPSVGPLGDGRNHLQIAGQCFQGGQRWRFGLGFPLHLQKQLRLFEKALPDPR